MIDCILLAAKPCKEIFIAKKILYALSALNLAEKRGIKKYPQSYHDEGAAVGPNRFR